jgi:hypothetical protein
MYNNLTVQKLRQKHQKEIYFVLFTISLASIISYFFRIKAMFHFLEWIRDLSWLKKLFVMFVINMQVFIVCICFFILIRVKTSSSIPMIQNGIEDLIVVIHILVVVISIIWVLIEASLYIMRPHMSDSLYALLVFYLLLFIAFYIFTFVLYLMFISL